MELNLIDKINQFNDNQKYTKKVRDKSIKKIKLEEFSENVIKTISSIPQIPGAIKKYFNDKKIQKIEDQQTLDMYASFLTFAEQTQHKTGIEFDPQSKNFRVIYTEFGPLFIELLSDFSEFDYPISIQAVEGFLPNDEGFLKYFNGQIQTQEQNNEVFIIGRNIDPETLKVSEVETTSEFKNNKILFYLKKQEELAKKREPISNQSEKEQ